MRKRMFFAAVALCAFLAASSLFAAPQPRIRIVATTFPLYDWTRQILGEQIKSVELVQLQDNGIDLHNFQPTVRDISRVSKCDLFIYIGGESDEWTQKALRSPVNTKRIALNMMKELGNALQKEKPLEGMEEHSHHHHHGKHDHDAKKGEHHDDDDDDDHDGHHDHDHDGHHEEEHDEMDEHVWLSLNCASAFCKAIAARLSEIDKVHAEEYNANCSAYIAKLQALDKRYKEAVAESKCKTLVFADRFPFRYLANDYGLTCYAAFSGCSAETEASFKTIAFLAGKVNEYNLPAIIVLENRRHKIAEAVLRTSKSKNTKIIEMDSLQSSTSRDAASGKNYLAAMEKNLAVLKTALDCKN